jgi:hypothetical protein
MPSFTQETIEEWREKRVSQSKIPKDTPFLKESIPALLRLCESDIQNEETRLQSALADVKSTRSNIRYLKKKRENILKRKAEMEAVE